MVAVIRQTPLSVPVAQAVSTVNQEAGSDVHTTMRTHLTVRSTSGLRYCIDPVINAVQFTKILIAIVCL